MRGTCTVSDCLNPVDGHDLCSTHRKRAARGVSSLSDPTLDRTRTPLQVALDASIALADADSEDDAAFRRAQDNWRKAVLSYARRENRDAVKRGLNRRRRAGLPVGRPPSLTLEQAKAAVAAAGGVRAAARSLGVSRGTLQRALRRTESKVQRSGAT